MLYGHGMCPNDMGDVFLWEKNLCCVDTEYVDMEDVILWEKTLWIWVIFCVKEEYMDIEDAIKQSPKSDE